MIPLNLALNRHSTVMDDDHVGCPGKCGACRPGRPQENQQQLGLRCSLANLNQISVKLSGHGGPALRQIGQCGSVVVEKENRTPVPIA